MNKATILAYILGGTALFCGAFLSFAVLSGQPLHRVAGLSMLVPPQEDALPARSPEPRADAPKPRRTPEELVQSHASVLGIFQVPAPFSNSRLRELTEELQGELRRVRDVTAKQREREQALTEREQAVSERFEQLARLRAELDALDTDLRLREQETARDQEVQTQRERESWRRVARGFQDGDATELAQRLTMFEPAEAALVLRELSDERSAALLQALPQAVYRDFVDAFRRVAP